MPAGIIVRKYFLPHPRHCNTQDTEANQLIQLQSRRILLFPWVSFFWMKLYTVLQMLLTATSVLTSSQSHCFLWGSYINQVFPGGTVVKKVQEPQIRSSWVRKIFLRRKWQPTPVFLPRKFHRQRSLVGYSPWGRKELDMIERLSTAHSTDMYVGFPRGSEVKNLPSMQET